MSSTRFEYTSDDIFILGNLASVAVSGGEGEAAIEILRVIQAVRPHNAGAFLLEAMHDYAMNELERAISLLETSGAFEASVNRDEAVAFHLFLLQQDGQIERAADLGQRYIDEALLQSDAAREMACIVTAECNLALGNPIFNTIAHQTSGEMP